LGVEKSVGQGREDCIRVHGKPHVSCGLPYWFETGVTEQQVAACLMRKIIFSSDP
jgi:hypothetical protein